MNRFTGPVLAALTITGCSFNYVPPIFEERNFSIKHGSKQESVLARSKKILKEEGFEIHSGDYKQGSITTVYREIKVSPQQGDCGAMLGMDYLYDNRTSTMVSFDLMVDSTTLTIDAKIKGNYQPNLGKDEETLECISYGVIEERLANKILKNLKNGK